MSNHPVVRTLGAMGLFAGSIAAAACADSAGGRDASNETTFDTNGDTIVARSTASPAEEPLRMTIEITIGQADGPPEYTFSRISDLEVGRNGEIYVWDSGERTLRMYDADGSFVRQIGRTGSGPGEYDRVNGLAVRGDGKLAVWDAGNGRVNLYAANGDFETSWLVGSGYFTSRGLSADSASNVYLRANVRRDSVQRFGVPGLVKLGPDGTVLDSLVAPRIVKAEPAMVTASKDGSSVSYSVPYHPALYWAMSPAGYFVAGYSDRYTFYALRTAEKPVKFDRSMESPAVDPDESANLRESTLWGVRQTVPEAQWNGPDIPSRKPPYRNLTVDADGRIWASVSQPSERIPESELAAQRNAVTEGERSPPQRTWRESQLYEVFAPAGHYLGRVRPPDRTTLYRMRGNLIWAVTLDAVDLPTVTRYRVDGLSPSGP